MQKQGILGGRRVVEAWLLGKNYRHKGGNSMALRLMMVVMLLGAAALTACETVKGVGKDVQNAGEAMDRTF